MKKVVCNLTIEAAVVNHGGAMEADTILKNGRSSKKHIQHFYYISIHR